MLQLCHPSQEQQDAGGQVPTAEAIGQAWNDGTGIRTLLAPVRPEEFFERCWERQPLLVARREPGYFSSLFSLADLDRVIYYTRPRFLAREAEGYRPNPGMNFLRGHDPLRTTLEGPDDLQLAD